MNLRRCTLAYINCGHLPPLIIDKHGVKQTLHLTGPVLGVLPDAEHVIKEVELDHGDLLFAYTDGLSDTENPAGEILGIGELLPLMTREQSLSTMLEQILGRVEAHAGNAKQFDDIAMLALRRV